MAQLVVRNLPEDLVKALKLRAAKHNQRHLSLGSRRKCVSSKRLYQRVLYCDFSDVRSIPDLQSMVQRMAKSLTVSHFQAGFYQATQLDSTR